MSNTTTEPTTREEIEAVLKAKIESGEAEAGLYNTGIYFVVARRSNDFGEPIYFEWFDSPLQFSDLLND